MDGDADEVGDDAGHLGVRTDEDSVSDAELTALALATDPDDVHIDLDAVPFGLGDPGAELLPSWYMPSTLHGGYHHRRRRTIVVAGLVASMFLVNAVGLCVTYGLPEVGDRITRFW